MSISVQIKKKLRSFTLSISFEGRGEPLGFLGASGCGKSMTLGCLAGILTPDEGKIIMNDRVLYDSSCGINLTPRERNIGMLFQSYALFHNITVSENIGVGIRRRMGKEKITRELLELFRLTELQNRYPGQLSGGEQQRTALARMLAYEPEALLLDEPFSALDSYLKEELLQELEDILRNYHKDIIMVSHNTEELYRLCDRIAVIDQGQVLEIDSKIRIFDKPEYHRTAKLLGVRNLSRAVKRSEFEVEAIDWGLCLKTVHRVEEEIHYVGIRSEDMRVCGPGTENSLPVSLCHIVDGPRELRLIFRNNARYDTGNLIHWTVPCNRSRKSGEEKPTYFQLPKEQLLLLK